MSDTIQLDSSTFKALVSDTRVEILKSLDDRRKTVSELSEELELAKSTVHEHLEKLTEAGLVEPDENHRKWVYYDLTEKGKGILGSRERGRRFLLLISTSILSLLMAVASGTLLLQGLVQPTISGQTATREPAETGPSIEAVPEATDTPGRGTEEAVTQTPTPTPAEGDLLPSPTEIVEVMAQAEPGLLVATAAALLFSGATLALAVTEYRRWR